MVTLFLPRGLLGLVRRGSAGDPPLPALPPTPAEVRREGGRVLTLLYLDNVSASASTGSARSTRCPDVLDPGEMRAVIGPNGAGKTTMMDIITGKTRPDTGRVVFGADTDLTRLDEPAIAALGIGRKFQKPTVFEPLSVWDNLLLALAGDRRPRFTLFARQTAAERDRIDTILQTTRLTEQRRRRAGDLSHGQKAVAGDRHAAGAGTAACCWWTNPSPA